MTISEIGRQHGTTPEAVRQIHAKALRELRKPRNSKRLRPFLPEVDRIYSAALIGGSLGRFKETWTSSTERTALDLLERLELQEERRKERALHLQKLREQIMQR